MNILFLYTLDFLEWTGKIFVMVHMHENVTLKNRDAKY
jgi:hypothetical protein